MSEEKFDAVVVGAGCAGCVAAYVLARAGLEVVVIERGNSAGSKNMTGGRLYAHSLERVMPGFAREAPLEREVTRENVSLLTADSAVTLDYRSAMPRPPAEKSYTVLRARFDRWLMAKAEGAGAQFIPGIRVDEPLVRDGMVCGVRAGDDEIAADVVVLADGVNSLLAEKLGMRRRVASSMAAVGVKELIGLPGGEIEDRFQVQPGEGAAWLFAGSPTGGLTGGGFLYTNADSVSLGVVCGLNAVERSGKSVPQMLEDFKQHPAVAPLVRGGKLLEYSGHVVPEGGLGMVPRLVGDGVLVVGDAAGLCLNVGYTIRGMDMAIASGEAAALAVVEAKGKGDFRAPALARYRELLDQGFVMKDLALYRNLPAFLETPRLFTQYPNLAAGAVREMFTVDGSPARPLWRRLLARCRQVGLWNITRDVFKGGRSI